MSALEYILDRFKLDTSGDMPVGWNGSRWHELISIFKNVGFKIGVEVGVEKGMYSKRMASLIPDVKLYCIDPWVSYGYYTSRRSNTSQKRMEEKYNEAVWRLAPFNCEIIRGYSHDVVHNFEDNSLDFVFIDANHGYEYALQDMVIWTEKVRVGGIVSGHDYFNDEKCPARCSVKDALDDFVRENEIMPWFVMGRQKYTTWFFVKEEELP